MVSQNDIEANFAEIRARIESACKAAGRDPGSVQLIAVTKTFPIEAIQAAYDLGHRHFGESRWQEAEPKIAAMPKDCVWHFIGKLQSNKAKRVALNCDVIHTIESTHQLREIQKANRTVDCLIEINIANEPQKSGIFTESLDAAVQECLSYEQLRLRGLMTIGPVVSGSDSMRPHFRRMRELLSRVPNGDWLSMGMSSDFEEAIHEGATHVRIGSALFGSRR